jgi:ABC-type transporter MlaC component
MKGLTTPKIEGKLSLRASITGEIVMDDVFVPEENLLPNVGLRRAVRLPQQRALRHRLGRAGRGRVLLARARDYTLDRKQFGRPLAANQLIQKKLADMQTEITLGPAGLLRLGRLMDEGKAAPEMISLLKRNNCGKALDIARLRATCTAATASSTNIHVMRHVLNLENRQHLRGHARRPRADPRPRADRPQTARSYRLGRGHGRGKRRCDPPAAHAPADRRLQGGIERGWRPRERVAPGGGGVHRRRQSGSALDAGDGVVPADGRDFRPFLQELRCLRRRFLMRVSGHGLLIAGALLAALSLGPARAQTGSAMDFMNKLAGQVGVLVDDRSRPVAVRRQEFQTLFDNASDNHEMARFAIGRYWSQLNDEQRRQYMDLFPVYMAGYYWKTFSIYYGSNYAVLSEKTDANGRTVVHTQIQLTNDRPAVRVDWYLMREGGAFKIVDVEIEGLSQNLSYRDYFADIIQHNGGDVSVVLDTMRQHPNG